MFTLGLQVLPQEYEAEGSKATAAFTFDNDTTMNLGGPEYALSLLILGNITCFFSCS